MACRSFISSGTTRRPHQKTSPAKTRVDLTSLQAGTGIHPPSPGTHASAARVGTHGAPSQTALDVELSCVAFREPATPFKEPVGRCSSPTQCGPIGADAQLVGYSRNKELPREPTNVTRPYPEVNAVPELSRSSAPTDLRPSPAPPRPRDNAASLGRVTTAIGSGSADPSRRCRPPAAGRAQSPRGAHPRSPFGPAKGPNST